MNIDSLIQDFWQKHRIAIKSLITGFLILVLLIPTAFIQNLVSERNQRQKEVNEEVSLKWANAQTVAGPFIIVPYQEYVKDEKGRDLVVKHIAYFLPENLSINGTLLPEIRYRSIYKIAVYKSDLTITGNFLASALSELSIPEQNILWNEVRVCVGLDDARGIGEQIGFQWDGQAMAFNPGIPSNIIGETGVSAVINKRDDLLKNHVFSIHLKLNGSARLFFTPLGKETVVNIQSPWTDPAFDGNFLPAKRVLNDKGFTAEWKILNYHRNIPQSWVDGNYSVKSSAFGVNLLQGTDSYAKTMRSVKYAILLIGLTFAVFFFLEILQKRSIHPLQYILVGLALCIFYTLLLSISEYISFDISYLIACSATVGLISLYTKSLFGTWRIAAFFALFLSLLYAFIFILIQLQDGALLFGSIGLFVLLAIVMYYSRKIDWSGNKQQFKTALSV